MSMAARSESRDGYAVRVLAVHTSEGIDKPVVDDAAALRDATWWEGSSHAIADDDPGSLLTPAEGCVSYDRASWTLRSGNRWSENIELIASAGWTRAQWLARPTLLDRCAYWLADRSKARGIPLVKLTPQQYRAGQSGVIGHNDHTIGYSDGTHWDPGPGFPWDVALDKARAYAAGIDPEEIDMTALFDTRVGGRNLFDGQAQLRNDIYYVQGTILAALGATTEQIAEKMRPLLLEVAKEVAEETRDAGTDADADAIAEAVVERVAARLGSPDA